MSKFARCAMVLLLVGAWLPAFGQAAGVDAERLAGIIRDGMAQWRVPGMAVAVIDDHEVVLRRGFGSTATEGGRRVDEHTLFANASTTKAMVVAGILMLADEGRLTLDDPVIRHIPELHFHPSIVTGNVTIRDLLAHRTGLPSTDYWAFTTLIPFEEQVRRLRLVEPVAGPRERLIYQNTMYEIAGLIIERVTGQRWDRYLSERLWKPIGMRETYGARDQIPARSSYVLPHDYLDGDVKQVPWDWPADFADAAGSAWTSIHDMSLWASFLLRGGVTADGERLISEQGIGAMFEPQQLAAPDDFYPTVELTRPSWRSYGLGWFQQDFQGRKIDFHTGSLSGLVAIIGLDRAAGRAVIVFDNRDHAELRHAILWEVMDNDPATERRDWNQDTYELYAARDKDREAEWADTVAARLTDTRPALPLDAYAGTYSDDVVGDIIVEYRDGMLAARSGIREYMLSHWQLDTFLVKRPDWRYGQFATFVIGTDGAVAALEFIGHGFERLPVE